MGRNAFEAEVQTSCRLLGIHYDKKPVATTQRRGRTILTTAPGYDSFIVLEGGKHVAIELKSQELHGSFPLANIQPHQLDGLQEMVRLGCPAYLIFNLRRRLEHGKKQRDPCAWALEFRNWTDLLCALPPYHGRPRRSIPRELFDDPLLFAPVPRVRVDPGAGKRPVWCWDMRVIR